MPCAASGHPGNPCQMGSTATDLSLKQTYDKTRELSQQAIQIIPDNVGLGAGHIDRDG